MSKQDNKLEECRRAECEQYQKQVAQAKSSDTSLGVFVQLMKHEDEWIRHAVASNPAAPPKVLTFLSKDKALQVRWAVASSQ